MREDHLKEVRFDKYCESCKYKELKDILDPCNDCLDEPVNIDSEKPVYYEAKGNGHE